MIRFNLSIKSPCCKLLVSVFKNLNQFVLHKNLNGQNTDRFPFFLSFFDYTLLSDLIHIFWGLEEENMIAQVSLITNDVYFN